MQGIDYIDTPTGVTRLLDSLPAGDYLAVDTEFVREKTYFPRPCLLQLARGETVAVIDLLADGVPEALRAPLLDPGVVKVLHSARQDLEVFHRLWGEIPAPVFDTQIAGALTGLPEQCGYAQAVEQLLGVALGKGHARTDWSRRPLSEAQLRYAADDVRYLVPLYHELRDRLTALGRADWPAGDFAALTRSELYQTEPQTAWRRVKNGRQLQGAELARLQALAAWREGIAIARDRPRRWILADEALIELARDNPSSRSRLESFAAVPPAVRRRYAAELAGLLSGLPEDATPPDTGPDTRMTRGQVKLARRLGKLVDDCAEEQGIAASALAPRADLKRLVLGERSLAVLSGWRRALIGERLLAAVSDAAQDAVANGASVSSS
jgi:ribonuclease D